MDSRDIGILAALGLAYWYFTKSPTSSLLGTTYPATGVTTTDPLTALLKALTGQTAKPTSGGSGSVSGGSAGSGNPSGGPSGTGAPVTTGSYINNQDPCDPSTPFYNAALCPDTPITNTPISGTTGTSDSMDPCDPVSTLYNPQICFTSSDSMDPCDPTSSQYDPDTCAGG